MRFRTLLLVVIIGMGIVAGGCDLSELNLPTTWPTGGGEEVPTPTETITIPTEGDFTWNDVPVYPGISIEADDAWLALLPQPNDVFNRIEWQYFQVNATVAEIAGFYHNQLTGLGWTEMTYMDMSTSASGTYLKNYETDMAIFWVGATDDDITVLALMRASK